MNHLNYVKDRPVAVLGGGATGQAQAADCALVGREVRLAEHPDYVGSVRSIKDAGRVHVWGKQVSRYGFKRDGTAQLDLVTTDVGKAVNGAGLIVVSVPATGHPAFFERLIPYLKDGMVIHIFPDNFGSFVLRRMMREAGCDANVLIGGWSSQPCGVRKREEGGVDLPEIYYYYRAITLRGAALPSTDQEQFLETAAHLPSMDSVVSPVGGDTVFDVGFSNVNPVLHVPGTLLSLGAMENWGTIYGNDPQSFSIYSHGYCRSIGAVQAAFYEEVCNIADALGVGIQSYDREEFFSRDSILGQEYMGHDSNIAYSERHTLLEGTGPYSVDNRYITEDIPIGCHIYHELARWLDVNTPIIDAMITLGSTVMGQNYFESGRGLEYLGIEGMSVAQVHDYVRKVDS